MNVLPVIERELRAESRRAWTQWMRPLGAGVALSLAAYFLLVSPAILRPGPTLFNELHHCVFLMIWLLVPLMTADCVSREKRELTLGLLFLTPLRAGEILMAKVLAQGLRAASVAVAVVPVLILPLLVGGVSGVAVLTTMMANAGAFPWALSAGIMASVLSRSVIGGLSWALLLALLFLLVHCVTTGLAFHLAVSGFTRPPPSFTWMAGIGLVALWNPEQTLEGVVRMVPPAARGDWLVANGIVVLMAALGLATVWRVGAWMLRRGWQDAPPSPRQQKLARQFLQPRFGLRVLGAMMRRRLERNPVGWLERRRWTSRAAFWIWLGVLALGQTLLLTEFTYYSELREMTLLLAMSLIGLLAMVSAASLARERESGILELLLTTPLRPEQIIQGRLRGIWTQFLPSLLFFLGVIWFVESMFASHRRNHDLVWGLGLLVTYYLTVPVGGLWFSLRSRSYVTALLLTLGYMGVLPWMGTILVWSTHLSLGAPFALALAFLFGVWGVVQLRISLGPLIAVVTGVWLLLACIELILSPEARGQYDHRRVPSILLILPNLVLGAGGFAHHRLLRELGPGFAERRRRRD